MQWIRWAFLDARVNTSFLILLIIINRPKRKTSIVVTASKDSISIQQSKDSISTTLSLLADELGGKDGNLDWTRGAMLYSK